MSQQKKDVLFITNEIPSITGGGMPIRDFNLLKHLSAKYQLTLVCYSQSVVKSTDGPVHALEILGIKVFLVHRNSSITRRLHKLHLLERILNPLPWSARYLASDQLRETVQSLLKKNSYALVHVNHVEMGSILYNVPFEKRVLGIEVVAPKISRLQKLQERRSERFVYWLESKKMATHERRLFRSVSVCTMASDIEKAYVQRVTPQTDVVVIPNGVDTTYITYMPLHKRSQEQKNLLFVGSLTYPPNQDAIQFFHQAIWTVLTKDKADLFWHIVGRSPTEEISRLQSEHIKVSGWVEDVRNYFHECDAMIVPLRSGGGTRLKILEAMASGIPVVSTTIGAEGLSVTHLHNILLADTPQDFVKSINMLLYDKSLAAKISQNARQFVEEKYDWQLIANKLSQVYEQLISTHI